MSIAARGWGEVFLYLVYILMGFREYRPGRRSGFLFYGKREGDVGSLRDFLAYAFLGPWRGEGIWHLKEGKKERLENGKYGKIKRKKGGQTEHSRWTERRMKTGRSSGPYGERERLQGRLAGRSQPQPERFWRKRIDRCPKADEGNAVFTEHEVKASANLKERLTRRMTP